MLRITLQVCHEAEIWMQVCQTPRPVICHAVYHNWWSDPWANQKTLFCQQNTQWISQLPLAIAHSSFCGTMIEIVHLTLRTYPITTTSPPTALEETSSLHIRRCFCRYRGFFIRISLWTLNQNRRAVVPMGMRGPHSNFPCASHVALARLDCW